MSFRKVAIPIVLTLVFLLQFLPGTALSPRGASAASCDVAQFVADVTIADGTSVAPGSSFVKTWRLKNVGSCTWTTSYSVVFASGDQLGAPAVINMPTSVAPGATVDVSVSLTAPSSNGHYRGNWKLRNETGGMFGIGAGNYLFWVDIYVNASVTTGTTYDFVANYCSAVWASGAGGVACPSAEGGAGGFVTKVDAPQLETGSVSSSAGLTVGPQQVAGGYIKGSYPAYNVQSGDRFQSIINCAYNATGCYVNFRLDYQIGGGAVNTLWSFNERYEGLYYPVNLDLSSLAGKSVNFILYVADVSGHGSPSADKAVWVGARITGAGGGYVDPIPPSSTCDKGAFVADVTVPDGSSVAAGSAFVKTWRIRNVGSCTWTSSYALVYVFGTPMGGSSVVNLPASVAPGETADFSVNMVAPSALGHYRSYWRFRNASGAQFGVGSGMITFFADINVVGIGSNPSTTAITADNPDSSTPGQPVAVTVTVVGASIVPTGTVAITGADSNCTLTLSGGTGSCNVVFNTSGTKTLTAVYGGDGNYTGSSDTEAHTVGASANLSSTTTITADTPDASTPGQTVAITVTVSGSGALPTGWVAVAGADSNCTITLSGGTGSCNVIFNSAGSRTLAAAYGGDGNYLPSSDTESHTVSKGGSTTSITSDTPDPSTPGQSVPVSVSVSGAGVAPTGTVVVSGADSNCTISLSGGSGSCNVTFSVVGSKVLTATYSGDVNYNLSSDTDNHVVTTATNSSTTTITADTPDPSVPGGVVNVSVSVIGSGTVPTGTVDITGADTNCTITLAGGNGTCGVIFNTSGAKTLIASYNGNSNYIGSSDSESHTVSTGLAATATTVTSTVPNPSNPGQTVTVHVQVDGAGVPGPTGTVQITGADTNCSILLAGGAGSCNVVYNSTGHKTVTASYGGDGNYAASTGTYEHIVSKGSTTTTIISALPNPSIPTQAVTVSFNVTGAGYTPTGTVSITGADVNCSITLSGGTGACSVIFNTIGSKNIVATYSGDNNYLSSTDNLWHAVRNVTTTTITSDITDPSTPGDAVIVSVAVSGAGVDPTGLVHITGADTNCDITLAGGVGSCTVTFMTAGAKILTAKYVGDANYVGSETNSTHTVNKGPTTTTITLDNPDPSVTFQSVTVTVTVTGAGVMPTGSVGVSMSGVTSTCTVALVAGTGHCSVVFDTVGNFTITATYSGDGNYLISSDTETHTVN
jgi:large repetitive protein